MAGTVCAALRAMDTRNTLRLQATCNGPAFRQMDKYTYALYFVQAREAALLAMPEVQGSLQTIPDRLPLRCRAARTKGRCRGTVAANSVTAPFANSTCAMVATSMIIFGRLL